MPAIASTAPLAEDDARLVAMLRRFAAFHGAPEKYHETITWAFLVAINERIGRLPAAHGWTEFAAANSDLVTSGRGLLGRYYRSETLESELARRCFVLPDRGVAATAAGRER